MNPIEEVVIEYLNLKKGTYFIDWSSNQNKRFHRQIVKGVKQSERRMNEQLDSSTLNELSTKLLTFENYANQSKNDSISKYKNLYNQEVYKLQHIRYNHLIDSSLYSGYYRRVIPKPLEIGHNGSFSPQQYLQESYKFIVTQRAVNKQCISRSTLSPDEFRLYINGQFKKNHKTAEKILKVLKNVQPKYHFTDIIKH